MNPTPAKFKDCQAQYEHAFFPEGMQIGFQFMQVKVHRVTCFIEGARQTPELVLKIVEFSLAALSSVPSLKESLFIPKQICKEAKNFTNFFKGFKSIDNLMHLNFSWRSVTLTVSGMTLFVLSCITLVERFSLLDVSAVKITLAAVPVLGVLPFGGLTSVSMIGLSSMLLVLSFDKQKALVKAEKRIEKEKLPFWSQPLNPSRIQSRQEKYRQKMMKLEKNIGRYDRMLQEGKKVGAALVRKGGSFFQKRACYRACKEIDSIIEKQKEVLQRYEKKYSHWIELEQSWDYVDKQEVENFRQAHAHKWKAKSDKIALEKRKTFFSRIKYSAVVFKNVLTIGAVMSGYGTMLPIALNVGIEILGLSCGMKSYFTQKAIRQIKISPIDFNQHVTLLFDDPEEHEEIDEDAFFDYSILFANQ